MLVLEKAPHSRLRAERMKSFLPSRARQPHRLIEERFHGSRQKQPNLRAASHAPLREEQIPAPRRAGDREIPSPHFPCVQLLRDPPPCRLFFFRGKSWRGAARRIDHMPAED